MSGWQEVICHRVSNCKQKGNEILNIPDKFRSNINWVLNNSTLYLNVICNYVFTKTKHNMWTLWKYTFFLNCFSVSNIFCNLTHILWNFFWKLGFPLHKAISYQNAYTPKMQVYTKKYYADNITNAFQCRSSCKCWPSSTSWFETFKRGFVRVKLWHNRWP